MISTGHARAPSRCLAAVALASAVALAGCASPRTAPAGAGESLSGRLSVRVDATATTPAQSVNGSFELLGTPQAGQLNMTSPLGMQVAQARWVGQRATLRTSEGEAIYDGLDQLTRDMLGQPMPVAALFDWLRGRPWPGAPREARADGQPGFAQMGWDIDLTRYGDGWVSARRAGPPAVLVRARLDTP